MKTTYVLIEDDHFQRIMEKLENLENHLLNPGGTVKATNEWLTNKQFKESVSIKAYNTFVQIRDKMPEHLKREINGKHYIHQDAVKRYFEGEFSKTAN